MIHIHTIVQILVF